MFCEIYGEQREREMRSISSLLIPAIEDRNEKGGKRHGNDGMEGNGSGGEEPGA